jgi:endonuclease/exonuclease/phosphatase family metal-dependent hydrolase
MHLTLVTYNIHACIGTDGRFEPARIASVLREMDADVVALQEVDHRHIDGYDLLDYLAAKTGLTAIAGPTHFDSESRRPDSSRPGTARGA